MFFHNDITERRNVLDIGGGKKKKEKRKRKKSDGGHIWSFTRKDQKTD
jgi:hypothetical protein